MLLSLFERVGLKTNTKKTEIMIFVPGKIRTSLTEDAYRARMEEDFRRKWRGGKVECDICGVSLRPGSLTRHLETVHDVFRSFIVTGSATAPQLPGRKLTARRDMGEGKRGLYKCPVEGCPMGKGGYGARDSYHMRAHFAVRHPRDLVEVDVICHRRCPQCGMQVGLSAWGTSQHYGTATCRRLMTQNEQHECALAGARAMEQEFSAYGKELRHTEQFRYLGRILSFDDSDSPVVQRNLKKARAKWGQISKVIARDNVPGSAAGMFYQAVVAAVLLYGSETWVVLPLTLRSLPGFHIEAARRLTGMQPTKSR